MNLFDTLYPTEESIAVALAKLGRPAGYRPTPAEINEAKRIVRMLRTLCESDRRKTTGGLF